MPDQNPVIIVAPDGTEHEFPPGMDPKRAAEIVRSKMAPPSVAPQPSWESQVGTGILKGAGDTAVGLGRLVTKIPGMAEGIDALYDTLGVSGVNTREAFAGDTEKRLGLEPTTPLQHVGKFAEQAGEFAIPAGAAEKAVAGVFKNAQRLVRGLSRIGGQAAVGAGMAEVQGTDPTAGAVVGGAAPVVGAGVGKGVEWVGGKAIPLARAGLKTAVRVLKGERASQGTLDATSKKIAKFIVDRNLATPEQAEAIIAGAERQVQGTLQRIGQTPTDAATRADRYLAALERRYQGTALGEDQIASVRSARAELKRMALGEDAPTTVMKASPILNPQGQPNLTPTTVMTRELRQTVPAEEALRIGRMQGKGEGVRTFGEQQGATAEASKAVERAVRDAAKAGVPELRAPLKLESQAIPAKQVLDMMATRTGNRDVMSLPGIVASASEVGGGKLPVIGLIAHWFRNNQLKAGRWAGALQRSIESGDVQSAIGIMEKIGAGSVLQTLPRQALIDQMRQE